MAQQRGFMDPRAYKNKGNINHKQGNKIKLRSEKNISMNRYTFIISTPRSQGKKVYIYT